MDGVELAGQPEHQIAALPNETGTATDGSPWRPAGIRVM